MTRPLQSGTPAPAPRPPEPPAEAEPGEPALPGSDERLPALEVVVRAQSARPVPEGVDDLVDAVRSRFGDAVSAVALYGSTLHTGDLSDGVVDLYVFVDSYDEAYGSHWARWANRWLAPNVYYVETAGPEPLRCKYAVLSLDHFERGCAQWRHPYVWARFAQPVRLVYARDEVVRGRVVGAIASAVERFLGETAALGPPGPASSRELWTRGLAAAYATELRSERNRPQTLADVKANDFHELLRAAAPRLPARLHATETDRPDDPDTAAHDVVVSEGERRSARRRWRARRWMGKPLSVARLIKASFTFDGGVDYLAWKIERHTGVAIEVTDSARRHPIRHGLVTLWRLLRSGVVK